MTSDIILLFVCVGLGILIGQNWRVDKEGALKKRLLLELDSELKDKLIIAENLNESLKQDITELKANIWKLKNPPKGS